MLNYSLTSSATRSSLIGIDVSVRPSGCLLHSGEYLTTVNFRDKVTTGR